MTVWQRVGWGIPKQEASEQLFFPSPAAGSSLDLMRNNEQAHSEGIKVQHFLKVAKIFRMRKTPEPAVNLMKARCESYTLYGVLFD